MTPTLLSEAPRTAQVRRSPRQRVIAFPARPRALRVLSSGRPDRIVQRPDPEPPVAA